MRTLYVRLSHIHTHVHMYTCTHTALQTAHLSENIKTNVAVTIGRLAIVDTLEVAELADEYFADWCRYVLDFSVCNALNSICVVSVNVIQLLDPIFLHSGPSPCNKSPSCNSMHNCPIR